MKYGVYEQRLAEAVNALLDEAARMQLTLEEFRLATEIARNMLIAEFEKTTRVDEITVRAEVWDKNGSQGDEP